MWVRTAGPLWVPLTDNVAISCPSSDGCKVVPIFFNPYKKAALLSSGTWVLGKWLTTTSALAPSRRHTFTSCALATSTLSNRPAYAVCCCPFCAGLSLALSGDALSPPGWYMDFGISLPALGVSGLPCDIQIKDALGNFNPSVGFKVGH